MIRSLMNMSPTAIIASLLAVIAAMSIHEMAHALVSWLLGDPTARYRGRLSLNPLAHIDWAGLLCLFLFGFGWAKPVPVDPRHYRNEKAGMVWTSFAGPVANVLLAFVCMLLYYGLGMLAPQFALTNGFGQFLMQLLSYTVTMNVGFAVFNLIPVPPLDGAKVFWAFLPDDQYYRFMQPQPWVQLVLLVVIFSGILNTPLYLMRSSLTSWLASAAVWFWGLFV